VTDEIAPDTAAIHQDCASPTVGLDVALHALLSNRTLIEVQASAVSRRRRTASKW
jgi:hypothetical protein